MFPVNRRYANKQAIAAATPKVLKYIAHFTATLSPSEDTPAAVAGTRLCVADGNTTSAEVIVVIFALAATAAIELDRRISFAAEG